MPPKDHGRMKSAPGTLEASGDTAFLSGTSSPGD